MSWCIWLVNVKGKQRLRRFPLVPGDDAAEPLLPFDRACGCAPEIGGDDVVADALVGALDRVVIEPDAVDVGQPAKTEADEVVQALCLQVPMKDSQKALACCITQASMGCKVGRLM